MDLVAILSVAGLGLVWVVYPAGVGLAALVKKAARPEARNENPPIVADDGSGVSRGVSVVIAAREADAAIQARIRDCLESDYRLDRLQIVIAYDRPDAPPDLSPVADPRVTLTKVAADAGGGKALALNAGVRAAVHDCLVFSDTHQRFAPSTIRRLAEELGRPGTGAVSGSLHLAPESGALVSMYWRLEQWLRAAEARIHSAVGVTGAVWAMRRQLWQPLPQDLILDDLHTPMRLVVSGHRIRFAGDAVAYETRTPTPSQEFNRKVRTLTGVIQLCAWLPAVLNPFRNPIWIQFLFHKVLRLFTPYLLALVMVWMAMETAAVLPTRTLLLLGAGFAVAAIWLALTTNGPARRCRQLALEGLLLQIAVVLAGINGLRGNWRVWSTR